MRSCRIDRQLVALYVLGHSTGREAEDVQKHVSGCSGCQEYVEELRSIQRGFKGVGVEEELGWRSGFQTDLLAEVLSKPKRSTATAIFWPVAIAASILVLAGVPLILRQPVSSEVKVEPVVNSIQEF